MTEQERVYEITPQQETLEQFYLRLMDNTTNQQ
jgi:hypothetical protein